MKIDTRQLRKLERAMRDIKNGVPRVMAPAINRALAKGNTVVKREIRKDYLIKAKDIPTKVHRATFSTLKGHIRIQQGMLDASKFRYTPKFRSKRNKPLFVQVKTHGSGGVIKRGFVTGAGAPYQRRSAAPRLPIRKILVIGAPIMATQPGVGPAVNKAMGDTFAMRLDHEINRVMASAGGHS